MWIQEMDGFAVCGSQIGEMLWASLAHIGER